MRKGVREITLAVNSATTFGLVVDPAYEREVSKEVSETVARFATQPNHVPFHKYQEVTRAICRLHPDWKLHGIWPSTIAALLHIQTLKVPEQEQLLAWVPPALLASLFDYQKQGVAFALSRGGRCLIADEPGVGKTRQGLAILGSYRAEWPCVVLCPSSLAGQWVKYIKEWLLADDEAHLVKCIRKGTDAMDAQVNVISYDLAAAKETELQARNFQVVVADESHALKSRTAKRTQVLLPVLSRCKRVILMSGTPALSRPSELFTQLFLLRRDVFHNFHEFGVRYCAAKKEHFGWNYDGSGNLDELHKVLEATCMIRRRKGEVLQDLPIKTREKISVQLTAEQLEVVEKSIKHLRDVTAKAKDAFVDQTTQQAAFLSVVRDVGKAKIPSTIEYLSALLDEGEKVVVFSHHQLVRDELQRYLERRQVKFIRIDGQTPPAARTRQVDEFQEDDDVRVALLSITAAGVGTTLTASHIVLFAELLFTPACLLQSEDRCHRIGQEHPVSVRYLVAKGTAEERVWAMLYNKFTVLGRLMGDTETHFRADHTTYDETITQTDMREFIAALLGESKEPAKTVTPTETKRPAEWDSNALSAKFSLSEKKSRKSKPKSVQLEKGQTVILPTSWSTE